MTHSDQLDLLRNTVSEKLQIFSSVYHEWRSDNSSKVSFERKYRALIEWEIANKKYNDYKEMIKSGIVNGEDEIRQFL